MDEIWRDLKGFEEYYEASNHGRIRSKERKIEMLANGKYPCLKIKKSVILKPRLSLGRNASAICHNGIRIDFWTHRLIAETFIPNPKNLTDINHIDGNPSNNKIENLEWCTRSENMQHAHRTGLIKMPKGSKHHSAKLTEEQVLLIRHRRSNGQTATALGKEFKVSQRTISEICLKHIWKHI